MQQTITPSVVRLDVSRAKLIAKFLSLAVVLAVAFSFVVKYVFHYYCESAGFREPRHRYNFGWYP